MYADVMQPKTGNPSGTKLIMSFAPIDTFATIEKPTNPGTTLGDGVKITSDHTFKTDGRFFKLEVEVNKNELNDEYQGDVIGNAQKQTFTGFASGMSEEQADLLRKAQNEKHIVLVHLADGKVRQIGVEHNGATITANGATGTQDGGERGFNITAMAYHENLYYDGEISYTDAV